MSVSLTPALRKDYEAKWKSCRIDYQPDTVKAVARRLLAVKKTCSGFWDVPWWFVALCWLRECNLNPKGSLAQGDPWNKKSTHVPKGRGPFKSWTEAAADALALKGYHKAKDWGVADTLFRLEEYNGFGYRNKGVPSPYLWSHTNHYADGSWDDDPKGGKYIRDHVWDGNVYDPQLGVCAVLKALIELDPTVTFGKSADIPPPPDIPRPGKEPDDPKPAPADKGVLAHLKRRWKEWGLGTVLGSVTVGGITLDITPGLILSVCALIAVCVAAWIIVRKFLREGQQ